MWAHKHPVRFAVQLRAAKPGEKYVWFSPSKAVEYGTSELTSPYPRPTVVGTLVTGYTLEETYTEDLFFVGLGQRYLRVNEVAVLDGRPDRSRDTIAATLRHLQSICDHPEGWSAEFVHACAGVMLARSV